jgi:ABC-type thiamine transport system ATPase subunit
MENVRDEMALYRKEMINLIREIQDTKDNITGMVKQNLNNNNYILYDVIWPDVKVMKQNKKVEKFSNKKTTETYKEVGRFEPLELKSEEELKAELQAEE